MPPVAEYAGPPDPWPETTDQDVEAGRWADLERRVGASSSARTTRGWSPEWVIPVVIAVLAGMTLHRYLPRPLPAVAVVSALLVLRLALQPEVLRARAAAGPEPDTQELDAYTGWLPRRDPAVPPETLAAVARYAAALRGRWRSLHLLIARREDGRRLVAQRFQPGDRVEIVLDDYIAEGDPQVAVATMAHEVRHCGWLPLAAGSLSGLLCGTGPVIVATWALPWPGTFAGTAIQVIALLAALRIFATVLQWGVEVSCDLGAAADQGAAAEHAVLDLLAAEDARMPQSFTRVFVVRLLTWGGPPPHPPLWLRRGAVTLWYGTAPGPSARA